MLSALTDILTEGLDAEDSPLAGNKFAARLTSFIVARKQLPDMMWLLALLLTRDNTTTTIPPRDAAADKDRRIRNLFLRNVRQYSLPDSNEEYYSIDFTAGGHAASSVVHGANGSGKTTVYASLEYLYLGRSHIADFHCGYNVGLDFFRSVGIGSDTSFESSLESGETVKSGGVPGLEVPAMFCSECDYFELTRHWNDKKLYIATQIGYGELLTLLSALRMLRTLFEIADEYARKKKEVKSLESQEKTSANPSEKEVIRSKIDRLNIERKNLNSSFLQEGGLAISNHITRFVGKTKICSLQSDKRNELNSLITYVEEQWKAILKSLETMFRPIIKTIMEDNLDKRFESIEISTKGEDLDVMLNILPRNKDLQPETKTPAEYFNTFRLKLFCIAFKMALLCCAEIKHRINMPFVVDDIFDSSDFCNRKRIRGFIRRMFESHKEAIRIADNSRSNTPAFPLQMLFFTQDNIIGENVYQGIKDFIEDSGTGSVKFSRLFRPSDIVTEPTDTLASDIREYDIDEKKIKTLNIEDPIRSYVRQ